MLVALVHDFPQKLQNHLYALIYDQWHMSARSLRYLHEKSGADECHLAIFIISGILIYLIIGDYARFVANTILIAVPILLTYVYPDEKPPVDNLLYYWSIYIITTLFCDPKPGDKGSYYWIKMLLLILLVVFPGEANITISEQHKNENNDQEKMMASSNGELRKEETFDQQSAGKETDSSETTPIKFSALPAEIKMISVTNMEKIPTTLEEKSLPTQQNQIPSEKEQVPEMKLQLHSEIESPIHKGESQTTLAQKSSVVSEGKPNVYVKESQIALPKKAELIRVKKSQIIGPSKKSQVLQPEKFTDTSILKSKIIPMQEPLTTFIEKCQNLPPSKLQTNREEIPQLTPLKISQSRQDKITFTQESQIFPVREIQTTYSKEHGTTYSETVQTVPRKESQVISLNEPQSTVIRETQFPSLRKPETTHFKIVKIIPVKNKKRAEEHHVAAITGFAVSAKEHQITSLKESEDSTRKESKIVPDKEIQITIAKKSEDICSKQLEISKVKKSKELQDFPMDVPRTTLPNGIISTNNAQFAPLKISTTVSTKESQNIPSRETEESHGVPKHELKAALIEEPNIFPAEELQVPAVPASKISHEKGSQAALAFETESVMQNSSTTELEVSMKESDTVTKVGTQINGANKIIDIPEQQSLSTPDTCIDLKKGVDVDTSERKKSDNAITWVATGKTIVTQYARNEQKHMTSRGLRFLHGKTGLDEFNLAILIGGITSVYLIAGQDAQMLSNAILTVIPILLTYVFPAEKPPISHLLIYWSAFGLLTIFDPNFEPRSGYYFIKVILLALLFLHPFDGAERILWYIELVHSDNIKNEPTTIFTKEELSKMVQKIKDKQSLPSEAPKITTMAELSDAAINKLEREESLYDNVPESMNPMLFNSEFAIKEQDFTSAESLSINYSPHDLTFEPTKYLVFNAPYDFENLTYLIRIRNTSTKHIAYIIKSNAIPRVLVTPPCGILPPKQKCDIAVTIKKMDKFVEQLVEKDRLAFDYVFCSPETKQFKFGLLQSEMRRRKNIYIKYNS